MASLNGFDATQFEPQSDRSPLPAGEYRAVIIDSEEKPTKAGTGKYLQLTIEIVDGEHKGRRVWDRLNLVNPNAKAVEIARDTLASICRAVNVLQPKDSVELHNIPLTVRVAVRRREDNGEHTNEVKGYKAISQTPKPVSTESADQAPWDM